MGKNVFRHFLKLFGFNPFCLSQFSTPSIFLCISMGIQSFSHNFQNFQNFWIWREKKAGKKCDSGHRISNKRALNEYTWYYGDSNSKNSHYRNNNFMKWYFPENSQQSINIFLPRRAYIEIAKYIYFFSRKLYIFQMNASTKFINASNISNTL